MYFDSFVPGERYVLVRFCARPAQCIICGHWDLLDALRVRPQSLDESGSRASSNMYNSIVHCCFLYHA